MKLDRDSSIEDVAFIVCTAMSEAGVTVVLSGGAAATIYAPKAHQTEDLDFVLQFEFAPRAATPITELGFSMVQRGLYKHSAIRYTLEFLDGPLAVGRDLITTWATLRKGEYLLHIISPTDSVKDRLAAAIHWHDLNSTRQAAEIAKLHIVDLDNIEAWCNAENGSNTYGHFINLLRS